MNSLAIFFAWALVGGTWAWSSSEVSCTSCGSECQSACGTRNFRACCFNFQRRRRADPRSRSAGVIGADSMALEGLLKPNVSGTKDSHLSQILHLLSRALAESKTDPAFYKDPPSLSSVLSPLVQESTEEETDDNSDLLPSSVGDSDGHSLDNVIYLAFKRPSPSLNQLQHQNFHQRYTPPPTNINK
uniref:Trissin n=1 Tax=Nephrops norvegicus TaxID=6829 RepID=A0A4D6BM91_NEPNO|nr:trissin [Nephrops norvegicus]